MFARFAVFFALIGWLAAPALAQVVTSEFDSLPSIEGWSQLPITCQPMVSVDDGWFIQDLDLDTCVPPKAFPTDPWTRSVQAFNGVTNWFLEFRAMGTTDQSEIIFTAPIALATGNGFGISYHVTMASDRIRFAFFDLPTVFFDLESGVAHRIRLELDNNPPASFVWFIDSVAAHASEAKAPFPSNDARVTWHGSAANQDALNFWDYIRFGTISEDGSADFNSDGEVDDFEVFYIEECIERSAAGEPAEPSCAWADINADNTVDCSDWSLIQQNLWTGATLTPTIAACAKPIPAVSEWGAGVLGLLLLSAATVVYRNSLHHPGSFRRAG